MSISLMSLMAAKRATGLLSSSLFNHILLVLMFAMTVSVTWTPLVTPLAWHPYPEMSCLLLLPLTLLLSRSYGPTPAAPAVLFTLLLPLLLVTPWPVLPLLMPLPTWPPPAWMCRLLCCLPHLPLPQPRMDPILLLVL